jgi:hypothetical protein
MAKHFKALIKLPIGTQEVRVEADSFYNAKMLLEGQYGVGSVLTGPIELLSNE